MADLEYDSLYQNSFKTLQSVLVNNVSDPKHRYKTPIVKTSRQFSSSQGFCGYPYIYLPPVNLAQSREVNDWSKAQFNFTFSIEVIGDVEDLTSFDKLSDEVPRILNSDDGRDQFIKAGLRMGRVSDSTTDEDFDEGKQIFVRRFTVTFQSTLDTR